MSSSSATACSRSSSPATPDSPDTLDPVVSQDIAPWLHSLSPTGFLIGTESQFEQHAKGRDGRLLELEDIIQEDAMADSSHSSAEFHSTCLSNNPPPSCMDVAEMVVSTFRAVSSTKPIPPPLAQFRQDLSLGAQCVVYPPKESCYNLPVIIPSIPEGGTKSRVETQVRVTVDLAHASASSGEPLRYDRVGSWKWLRLPKGTSTKRRSRKEAKIDAPPEDTLYLTTEVTCASPPYTRVTCCTSCQGREAKRVARKLAARVRPARLDSEPPEDAVIIPGRGRHEDISNLVQFNCPEILDFSAGSVILPLRITCYCRHHREKVGFNVRFTMLDYNGRVVGSGMTRPIMITDDHKSTGVNKVATNGAQSPSTAGSPRGEDLLGGAARRKSTSDGTALRAKKRSKPYDGINRGAKLRRRDSITSLQSIPSAVQSTTVTRAPSRVASPEQNLASSPLYGVKPEYLTSEAADPANAEIAAALLPNGFDPSMSSVPNGVQQSMDDILVPEGSQMNFEPPAMALDEFTNHSLLNNDSSDPLSLGVNPSNALSSISVPSDISYMLFNHDPSPHLTNVPVPKIHRLIPSSGPTYGGIEITVLGANFHPAMQLNCVFGDSISSSTQRWSDNTLVCLLPASANPGVVPVWFDGIPKDEDGNPPCLFTYTDETDRALMELALQVVGMKMTGKIEDARNVAMRIVTGPGPDNNQGTMDPSGAMQIASSSFDIRQLMFARASDSGDFQKLILDFLTILDVPVDATVPVPSLESAISLTSSSGQTLLHYAAILNFSKVADFLLSHGIDVDARDKNGFTALHFAASRQHIECARLLLEARADMDVVNALGKTPAEIAPVGYFSRLYPENSSYESAEDSMEEEAAWADEEFSSDDDIAKPSAPPPRRKFERGNMHLRHRLSRRSSELEIRNVETDLAVTPSGADSKNAAEVASVVDEKQAMASWMDMVQRTLAQLQHPQGMIPNLSVLQLPQLPVMPAWNALPQMPAVFPVVVPISGLQIPPWASWAARQGPDQDGQKRSDGEQDGAESERPQHQQQQQQQAWLGIPAAQDWRATWEKWLAMATAAARPTGEEDAPPAYTPRYGDVASVEKTKGEGSSETATLAAVPQPSAIERTSARRVEYEDIPVPEQEVQAYAYRPAKKQSRKTRKKQDCMLFFFWIPILFIGFLWAFLSAMRIGFHALRAISLNGVNAVVRV